MRLHVWETQSRHLTSQGVVAYQRCSCACGLRRVVVQPLTGPCGLASATMSDVQPPQPPHGQQGQGGYGTPGPQPGAPGPQPGGPGYGGQGGPVGQWQQVGVVPQSLDGVFYSTGMVILLTILTCGIFGAFWTYRTSEDLKKYNGDGLGGVLGVVIFLLLSVVLMFTIPAEIEKMYQRDGRESPVGALWGLWFLLPIIGNIIWYVKMQEALNDFWVSKGARPA